MTKSDLKGKKDYSSGTTFYAGNKFYMFYKKTYTDVRMVAAPPSSVVVNSEVKPTTGCGLAIQVISPCSVSTQMPTVSLPIIVQVTLR